VSKVINIKLKIPPPEGFSFISGGDWGTPAIGEYVLNTKTNTAIRMCAGMPPMQGFLLERDDKLPDEYRGKKVIEVSGYDYKHHDVIGFMYKGDRWAIHDAVALQGFFGYLYRVRNTDLRTYEIESVPLRGEPGFLEIPVAILFNKGV